MSSDTPRTDTEKWYHQPTDGYGLTRTITVNREFARDLERECSTLKHDNERHIRIMANELAASEARRVEDLRKAASIEARITVPERDYSAMTPKDCYEAGLIDGGMAIRDAIRAAFPELESKEK